MVSNDQTRPGETRSVARGAILSFALHPVAWLVMAIIGSVIEPGDGALLALPFIAFIGATQWLYLGPVAWLLRRRGSKATAWGVVIAGGLVTGVNLLFYGGVAVMGLNNAAEVRRIQQEERDHPRDYISTDGVVTVVDDSHFEFRREDNGAIVSLKTWLGLEYIFLKKDGGYETKTRDILKPGVRVSVEYSQERGQPPISPLILRVYEEGARR